MIKLLVIYVLCVGLFQLFDMTPIVNLINAVIDYITSTSIFSSIQNVFRYIGNLLDTLIFNSESLVTTSGGIELGNLVWLGTIVRIAIVLILIKLVVRLVI